MDTTLLARDALSGFKYYYYSPSMAAAIIFIALFGITTAMHSAQMVRGRTWLMIPFLIGGVFETIGYVGRTLSAKQNPGPYTLTPYIMQSILLLVAPALFAASIYMLLARIVAMVDGDRLLFIRRTWLTKIFVCGDVLSFLMQASGGGLMSSGGSSVNLGKTIIVVGLILQIIFFGLFAIAGATFHIRLHRAPTRRSTETPWRKHLHAIYIVSVLILIRSLIRVIEYIQGFDGYIITHEIFLYIFDATLMFLAMAWLNWVHPAEVKELLAQTMRGGMTSIGHSSTDKDGLRMDYRPV